MAGASKQIKILVADDERTARITLAEILRMEGYEVLEASGGEAAILLLRSQDFDVVLCDLKMPEVDGLQVLEACQQQRPDTEFILLTAYGSMDTAVEALRRGASDYLLKPALPDTILSSLAKALDKRRRTLERQSLMGMLTNAVAALQQSDSHPPTTRESRILQAAGIVLDLDLRQATRHGEPLTLTPTEFELLAYLIKNGRKPVSAEEMVARVHGYATEPEEARSLVRVHISRLRQKVEKDPTNPGLILTVRGVGYSFGSDEA